MKTLKVEKKKRNWSKKLNLLSKKDGGLQLFSSLKVQAICNFVYNKKIEKE